MEEVWTTLSTPKIGATSHPDYWRTFKPVLDPKKCTKCLRCWISCPDLAIIRKKDNSVEVNYDYCKGCGICANECPSKAIEMVKEE